MPSPKTSPDERMMVFDLVRSEVAAGTFRGPSEFLRRHRGELPLPARQTIGRWSHGANSPYTGRNLFDGSPSPELSFFVGAWIGDGWADDNDGGKRLRLKVKSRDFAEEFARCASVVLKKGRPYRVWTTVDEGGAWYNAKVTSVDLYDFVNGDMDSLKSSVSVFPEAFLRGIYTAEGNPAVSVQRTRGPRLDMGICISNSDYSLMCFTRALLIQLGFNPAREKVDRVKGERTSLATTNKTVWQFYISRRKDIETFSRRIGFADGAKQQKLSDALLLVGKYGSFDAVPRWLELYEKQGFYWVRKPRSN